tara:strand:- start:30 stop:953 length:924 start_codon:yes stop_codon:yes gene_type:complete
MIHEIRETIQQSGTATEGIGTLQFQKRINLQEGMRHTINHIDFFDDGLFNLGVVRNSAYQVFVTNYPIVITDNTFNRFLYQSGPLAGEDCVLFKANGVRDSTPQENVRQEFPNQFLGSMPTFSFYTPQLYFTIIIDRLADEPAPTFEEDVQMSLYMAVESTEVNAVEYGIGMLQEYSENQAMLRRSQGIVITQADIRGALPMWQIGGIRPEFMASNATNVLGENWFFSTAGYGGAEAMSLTDGVRAGLADARQMVGFGDAFGSQSGTKAIPDWFKAIAKPFPGLESGPIRAQEPPLKHFDNGNVMML